MTKEIEKPDYSKMNIYQKLVEVKRHIKGLSKDGSSGSGNYGYQYITPSKVYGTVNEYLNEVGLYLHTEIVDYVRTEYQTTSSKGKEIISNLYDVTFKMTWTNTDDPKDQIVIDWFAGGCNGTEKGLGSAITYGTRYFLQTQFLIANDKDDVDALEHVKMEKANEVATQDDLTLSEIDKRLKSVTTVDELTSYKSLLSEGMGDNSKELNQRIRQKLTTHENMINGLMPI